MALNPPSASARRAPQMQYDQRQAEAIMGLRETAERIAAERRSRRNAERYGGCTLGEARTCDYANSTSCVRCGWYEREANRRKTLPLWRDVRGLWRKRVGVRQSEANDDGKVL